MQRLFSEWRRLAAEGRDVVLCSVVAASGSSPRGTGAKMLVLDDGATVGTIGGGAVEQRAIAIAKEVHRTRRSLTQSFDLSAANISELGMVCGGNAVVHFQYATSDDSDLSELLEYEAGLRSKLIDAWLVTAVLPGGGCSLDIWAEGHLRLNKGIHTADLPKSFGSKAVFIARDEDSQRPALYIEPLVQSGRVIIFGGGHVSQALVPVLAKVGFNCVVFEDRPRFARLELFPGAIATIEGDFADIGAKVNFREEDCIVIMTRGHEGDYTVLEQALRTPVYYLGLIGSKHKMAHTQARLLEAGFSSDVFARIHNPIGLPILADTPEEIAISVAAEMILCRATRNLSRVEE